MSNKDLPKIFKNEGIKKTSNNTKVFYSANDYPKEELPKRTIDLGGANSYFEAIDRLFSHNQFIFNLPVEIITKSEIIYTSIVSKIDNHIITKESRIIELGDIISIKIKDR